MRGTLKKLSDIWKELYRPTAFRQWQYTLQMRAENEQRYREMFSDSPTLEPGCEVRLDRERIRGTVLNAQQDSVDGSIRVMVKITKNDSSQNSYEARAYKVDSTYTIDSHRLTKTKDADQSNRNGDLDEFEKKYALREYAQMRGIEL